MKKAVIVILVIHGLSITLFLVSINAQDKSAGHSKNILTEKEALSVFAANGDSMIIRPEHLGIVNGMATVGISHDYVGVIDGLWAQPLVSSDFYIEPRLWGERIKTDHYNWLPYQTKQVGRIKGVDLTATTTLIYDMRAGLLEMRFKNSTNEKKIIPVQFIANDNQTYKSTLDYVQNWGFSTVKSKTFVTEEVDADGIQRVQGKYAVAIGVDIKGSIWEKLTNRFHSTLVLAPGEEVACHVAFSIEEKGKAVEQRDALLADPSKYVKESTEKYVSQVRKIFENLPRLSSDNQSLVRFYNRSLSIFITIRFTIPELVLNPYFATGAVKGGCQGNYLYNFGQVREIMPLVDPEATKTHIWQFLSTNCVSDHYAFFPMTGEPFGVWYMVNDEKITALVYDYVKYTGDIAFLSEKVKGEKTVLDLMIESALRLDDKTKPVSLIDYGPTGDHLELRREFPYNHIMPDINGRRYANYERVSKLCETAGKPQPYLMERARGVKKLLREELWDPDIKWFRFADDKGTKDIRYTVQMFKMVGSGVLDKDIEDGLISHLNEKEFLSPYGLHSMSKKDNAYDQVDIDNGGGGICTSFPPLIAEFLYNSGRAEIADEIMQRILWWGSRMPYLGDSQSSNEIDYRTDTPLQSEIGTGCLAQCILFGIFGIDSDFMGNITINPKKTRLSDNISLSGLKLRGHIMDISLKGNEYSVVDKGKIYTGKIGSPTVIKNGSDEKKE
jgi:hypothetical protein